MNKLMENQTHEGYWDREIAVSSSDRSFGFVMAAVLAVITLINVWHVGRVWPWTGTVTAFFLGFAVFRPAVLRPLNWIWFRFGLILHRVVNPIVMGLVFFG